MARGVYIFYQVVIASLCHPCAGLEHSQQSTVLGRDDVRLVVRDVAFARIGVPDDRSGVAHLLQKHIAILAGARVRTTHDGGAVGASDLFAVKPEVDL